jgi:hypothetical protein
MAENNNTQNNNTESRDWAGGAFMALIVLFFFGLFKGLPVIGWALWVAAFLGLFVACMGRNNTTTTNNNSQ